MVLLKLTIVARSPLAFPTRKAGVQFRRSLDYVPGAAIYGALGLRLKPQRRDERALFHAIRCHNAYPAWPEDEWSRPLPRTAHHPKGDERNPSDTLVDQVCWELLDPRALIFSPTDDQGRAWEVDSGFHAPPLLSEHDLRAQIRRSVQQRVLTRVSINRRRGVAEDQLLYSPLALSEVTTRRTYVWDRHFDPAREQAVKKDFPSHFLGSAVLPDGADLAGDLRAITHVGGRITTGLGSVEVQVQDWPAEDAEVIRARIDRLTAAFRERATLYGALGGSGWSPEGTIFTIDLLSDAILYEQGWRPTMVLTGAMLREAANLQIEPRLLRSFAAHGYASGWNVSWSGPKPTEVSALMGNVYVFQVEQGLAESDYERLAALQFGGIGERRAEGFGQVRVCDEFHIDWAIA